MLLSVLFSSRVTNKAVAEPFEPKIRYVSRSVIRNLRDFRNLSYKNVT